LLFFEGNKTHSALESNFDKVIIAAWSNNAGVWGQNPQPPEANGCSGAEPPTHATII